MLLMSMLLNNSEPGLSGYEFALRLKEPIPFIWPVKHSQIYPALNVLEEHGDITGSWVEQRGRPNKKVYTLAEQGRQRLLAWLIMPRTTLTYKEAMLCTYNLQLIGFEELERILLIFKTQCEQEKHELEARWGKALKRSDLSEAAMLGVRSVYEFALSARDARIGWCDWVVDHARALETQEKRSRSA